MMYVEEAPRTLCDSFYGGNVTGNNADTLLSGSSGPESGGPVGERAQICTEHHLASPMSVWLECRGTLSSSDDVEILDDRCPSSYENVKHCLVTASMLDSTDW